MRSFQIDYIGLSLCVTLCNSYDVERGWVIEDCDITNLKIS